MFKQITIAIMGTYCAWLHADFFAESTKPQAVYDLNETITFKLTAKDLKPGGEILKYRLTVPGENKDQVKEIRMTTPEIEIKTSASTPGFVFLQVYKPGKQLPVARAGAAVAPDKIQPAHQAPKDFIEFWRDTVKELEKQKIMVKLTKIEPANATEAALFDLYDVELKNDAVTVQGCMTVPVDKKRRYVVMVSFNGASKVGAFKTIIRGYARGYKNVITFNMNIHNSPVDIKGKALKEFRKQHGRYMYTLGKNPREYEIYKIFQRVITTMLYMKTLPEWNGKELIVRGGSFGGAQALVAAALIPEVTFLASLGTALCDHYGAEKGRVAGWPEILKNCPDSKDTAGYFDMVNFAPYVKCKTVMAAGFIDDVCPPSSIYAAYNHLGTADKKIYHAIFSPHGQSIKKGARSVFSLPQSAGSYISKISRQAQ